MAKKATIGDGTSAKGSRSAVGRERKTSAPPPVSRAGEERKRAPKERDPIELYAEAMSRFHARDFPAARELFLRVAEDAPQEISHTARLHARVCEQRIGRQAPVLETAEDRYNYAVALINQRRLEEAQEHLQRAASESPDGDHILYAFALCAALRGDMTTAYQKLKRAIELQPRNRTTAQNDPDFAEFARTAPLRELVFP
jgi:tetratricopeptide (TPR) repeat protein